MSDLAKKIQEARAAGHADEAILQYLAGNGLVDMGKAREALQAGHEPTAILSHLAAPQEPTIGDRLGRAFSLAGRNVIEGAAGLPMMVADGVNAIVGDLPVLAYNKITGDNAPTFTQRFGKPSDTPGRIADAAGLARPETRGEKVIGELQQIVSGTGAIGKVAQYADKGLKAGAPIVRNVVQTFAEKPGAQIVAGTGSTLSVDQLKNTMGVNNPYALAAVGMIGGAGTQSLGTIGKETRTLVQPFTQQGREAIVGGVLNRTAANPQRAIGLLDDYTPSVPGSVSPTAGAARDVGLAGAETAIRGLDINNIFGQRIGANNRARMTELDRISGDARTLQYAEDKRARVTGPMRENAFDNAVGPVSVEPALGQIQQILTSPQGARQDVQAAMQWAQARLAQAGDDPRRLYEVRKDIAGAINGKYDSDNPALRLAAGQLKDVVRVIDSTIEAAAPGYGKYMERFSTMSQPIDQMRLLQEVRGAVTRGQTDLATGQPVITASALRNQLAMRSQEIAETLSPAQQRVMQKIIGDIDRSMAATAPGVKVPGSDTFRNMSMGNMIGRMFSENMADNTTLRSMTRPLDFLYKLPDQAVTELLVQAMADPKLAAELMKKANVLRVDPVAKQLKDKAAQMGYGGIIGSEQ